MFLCGKYLYSFSGVTARHTHAHTDTHKHAQVAYLVRIECNSSISSVQVLMGLQSCCTQYCSTPIITAVSTIIARAAYSSHWLLLGTSFS